MTTDYLKGPTKASARKAAAQVTRVKKTTKPVAKGSSRKTSAPRASVMLRELQSDLDALSLRIEKLRQRVA